MIRSPRWQGQLGRGPTASRDCGPRSIQVGIDYLTRGQFVPQIPEIRERMGKAGNKTTNTADAQRCVASYDKEMVKFKRLPLRYQRLTGEQHLDVLEDALKAGQYAHLAIDYGVFSDRMRASGGKVGDPRFRGGHSVGVLGWKRDERGVVYWRLFDPLDDKRRPIIPKGPRWVRRGPLVAALKAYGSYFGVLSGGSRTP